MKRNRLVFFLLIALCPVAASAETIDQQQTKVGVTITAPTLWLETVSDLHFGVHQLSAGDASLSLHPKEDLLVTIRDSRPQQTPWHLSVTTSSFSENKKKLEGTSLQFGKGELIKPDKKTQQLQQQVIPSEKQTIVLRNKHGAAGNYTYRVPKETLTLKIPENNQAGIYQAKMNWLLSDAP